MIRLIATDLDGTLLNEKKEITELSCNAIKGAIRKGIIFAAASGRFYNSLNNMFTSFDKNMILICHNGAWVQKANNGEIIYKSPIDIGKTRKLIKFVKEKYNLCIYLCQSELAIIDTSDEKMKDDFKRSEINYAVMRSLLDYEGEIYRIGMHSRTKIPMKIINDIREHFSYEFEITLGGEKWLDFMNKDITKGKGIEMIQRMYNIKNEETMVFGDYYNDVDMFKKAYYSYAMEHSPDEVKKHAKFIAKSNMEDGVAEEILKVIGQ